MKEERAALPTLQKHHTAGWPACYGRHGPKLHHTLSAPPGRRQCRPAARVGSAGLRGCGQQHHQLSQRADLRRDVALPAWRRYRWPTNSTLPKPSPEMTILLSSPVTGPTPYLLCLFLLFTSGKYRLTPVRKRTLPFLNVLSMTYVFSSRYWPKYSYGA